MRSALFFNTILINKNKIMKTAMQELYEDIEKFEKISVNITTTDIKRMIGHYYNEKEKQQLKEAVKHGLWNNEVVNMDNYSEIYYQETFGDSNDADA